MTVRTKAGIAWLVIAAIVPLGCHKAGPPQAAAEVAAPTRVDGGAMVLIPGGSFVMGSRSGRAEEKPVHKVWVDAFLIDQHEVTQAEYEKLGKIEAFPNPSHFQGADLPVEQVTWPQAARYCNARSRLEGLQPCYNEDTGACDFEASGYRLPTEAEWECACRAGTDSDYAFGSDPRPLGDFAWFAANAAKKTHPVGRKRPNSWGLFDMHGNVAEWCHDVYDPAYYQSSPEKNPRGPESGNEYVLRGGSWKSAPDLVRSASRLGENPGFSDACLARDAIGFRCVRSRPPRKLQDDTRSRGSIRQSFEAAMLFHTWVFFVFFLIVYPVYLIVRRNNQLMNLWLMLASYTFYGWWNPWYLLLLFGTSAIDYLMVVLMERSRRTRTFWLVISLVSNFGFLGYFKYSGFITDNANALLAHLGLAARLADPIAYPNAMLALLGVSQDHFFARVVLPIGISFHTFQSMSYTIDAYNGVIQTERSFVRFLTFVSFFPQLVAGPIERAHNLLPQLQQTPKITQKDLTVGLSLFLVGFFKKVALADYLAQYVDPVYGNPGLFQAPALILATLAFGWQIYFDFSGYTDMARGIALLMGFRMMLNFNNPYAATGLGDFWNRWHISLSTWFKDYLYFPLGGSRRGATRTYVNIIITMLVSGIWHGAAWTFVVWGGLHALGRCLTRELEQTEVYQQRIPRLAKQLGVFTFVTFTWIFFRAQSLTDASLIIGRIFTSGWADPRFPVLMAVLILAVWVYQLLYTSESSMRSLIDVAPVRVGLAGLMIAYLVIVAQPSTKQFIYFQF